MTNKTGTALVAGLVVLCAGWTGAAEGVATSRPAAGTRPQLAQRQATPLMDSLREGKVELTFEGIDEGANVRVTVAKTGREVMRLVLPAGPTEFAAPSGTLTISSANAVTLDLSRKTTATFTATQEKGMGITKGSFILRHEGDHFVTLANPGLSITYRTK